jgi:thioredoxin reductase (NADPH)
LTTKVLEGPTSGGLVTTTEEIDNYLGLPGMAGLEMADTFKQHAVKFGAEIVSAEVESIVSGRNFFQTITTDGRIIDSKTVIFAAGSTPRKLGVSGEDLSGVSYCATCDGLFFEGDPVAVVGGGETAAEEALYLAGLASSVDVLVRGDAWKASSAAVARLEAHPKVTVHMSTQVEEVLEADGEVAGLKLSTGHELAVNGVFVAVGQNPNSVTAAPHVALYSDGFIHESNVAGFFPTGDIATPEYRQVIVAAGEGAKAGIDATNYLLAL